MFVITVILLVKNNDTYIIPEEAIRFRIIANSNSLDDQLKKAELKQDLEQELSTIIQEASSYSEANMILKNNIGRIEEWK